MRKREGDFLLYLLCGFFVFSEVCKQILLTKYQGYYDWWYFPFQLCSMPIYLLPLHLFSKNERIREMTGTFLIDYGMMAGILVFLDTSGFHYPIEILTVHSYLWHILMIVMGILLLRRVKLSKRSFIDAFHLYLFLAMIAEILNILFRKEGIDMYYLSPFYPMSQIVYKDVRILFGNGVSLFLYFLSIPLGAFLFHLLLKRIQRSFEKKT